MKRVYNKAEAKSKVFGGAPIIQHRSARKRHDDPPAATAK